MPKKCEKCGGKLRRLARGKYGCLHCLWQRDNWDTIGRLVRRAIDGARERARQPN